MNTKDLMINEKLNVNYKRGELVVNIKNGKVGIIEGFYWGNIMKDGSKPKRFHVNNIIPSSNLKTDKSDWNIENCVLISDLIKDHNKMKILNKYI